MASIVGKTKIACKIGNIVIETIYRKEMIVMRTAICNLLPSLLIAAEI